MKEIFPKQRKKHASVKVPNNPSSLIGTHMHARNIYHPGKSTHPHSLLQLSVRFDLWFRPKIFQPIHSILRRAASHADDNVSAKGWLSAVGGGKCQYNKLLLFKPINSKQAFGKLDKNTQMTLVFWQLEKRKLSPWGGKLCSNSLPRHRAVWNILLQSPLN